MIAIREFFTNIILFYSWYTYKDIERCLTDLQQHLPSVSRYPLLFDHHLGIRLKGWPDPLDGVLDFIFKFVSELIKDVFSDQEKVKILMDFMEHVLPNILS
jgi:hypothetical protein